MSTQKYLYFFEFFLKSNQNPKLKSPQTVTHPPPPSPQPIMTHHQFPCRDAVGAQTSQPISGEKIVKKSGNLSITQPKQSVLLQTQIFPQKHSHHSHKLISTGPHHDITYSVCHMNIPSFMIKGGDYTLGTRTLLFLVSW